MNHAPKGGTIGTNGEFYEGGKFLPSTTLPKRHQKKTTYTGPRKQPIAPYEWAERPEGMTSLYDLVMGTFAEMHGTTMAPCPAGVAYYGSTVTRNGTNYGTVDTLIARYNAGERWIEVAS
jgi:hypothetical protein